MSENILGGLIIIFLVVVIFFFYFKNKKEGKDDYSDMHDGSGNIN
jgi:uncharacterized membrane protein|tara:strand:- start:636 stop:770 length:135 start_codon:yes stop_codon:yes gene_type:complete